MAPPCAETEQRRQYDTSALRDVLGNYPSKILPVLEIENEQRRPYDTAALRAALANHPSKNLPVLNAENEQRREYDTTALRDALADSQPAPVTTTSVRTSSRHTRHSRRPTSYFNAFQTSCSTSNDAPPSYLNAARTRGTTSSDLTGPEILPEYSCSVSAEAKLSTCVESRNPLSDVAAEDWKESYVIVRGTMLSVYRLKDGAPGKLARTYTLQHAEVGLAPDVEHTVLIPQSRFACFIPSSARKRAWQKDQDLFKPVQQTVVRLRAETDQILLSGPDEDVIQAFMFAIGSAIDIAQPIDDRSIPRQCTVPRRRRRQRPQFESDLTNPALLAEQERIFQSMYPGLAAERQSELPQTPTDQPTTPAREDDEVDVSLLREDSAAAVTMATGSEADATVRPSTTRQETSSTINSTFSNDMIHATSPANFDLNGKWSPPHIRSPVQIQRYLRRCLPLLLVDSPRASDIVISGGRRVKVNWRMELLEDWELQPPTYKSHEFPIFGTLIRTQSHSSGTESESALPQSSGSLSGNEQDDQITPIETGVESLQLTKVLSTADKRSSNPSSPPAGNGGLKAQDPREMTSDMAPAMIWT